MPIVLLLFGLFWQKRGSLWELNSIDCLPRTDESWWDVASLHNFSTMKTDSKSGTLSRCFVVLSPEAKVVLNLSPHTWGETAIQHNEKLIHRWETKRFALLTSCWLPVELHLVAAFGFVVACHHVALWWWVRFQGNYIGTFWQWHLPHSWKNSVLVWHR